MNEPHKVVWSEGLLLTPQHFQQAEQYHDMVVHERLYPINPYGWGFMELEIDSDALQNGTVMVRRCRAVMPDGLIVRAPDHDPLPPARSLVAVIPPAAAQIDVLLGIAAQQVDGVNCRIDELSQDIGPTRYVAVNAKVHDQISGDVRELQVAQKNFKIFLSNEDTSGYLTMKMAELVRTQGGGLTFRHGYVPPCLILIASRVLTDLLRGLFQSLSAKRNALAAQCRPGEIRSSDFPKFMLFHVLNTSLPVFAHLYQSGRAHPETLYLTLAQVAGGLSTVSDGLDPTALPPYDHDELGAVFGNLDLQIRSAMERLTTARYDAIPLNKSRECVWEGSIQDDELLKTGQFYFVASGEPSDETLQDMVPRRVKVSAAKDVDVVLSSALPGLRMMYVSSPPATLPVAAGSRYFRIEKQGDFWESVCRSRVIAFYVPPELDHVRLQLLAIR